MSKLSKKAEKEKLTIQDEIAMEIAGKYFCRCKIEELSDEKLYDSVIKLLNKQQVPLEEAVATLKYLIHNLYFQDIVEERELEFD